MERINKVNLTQQFRSDYQRYGIYVTYRRIMCDIRDGLKPVQRRILYSMYDMGATNHFVKSGTIVGNTMKWHAHGDSSCYDTMKPMTNWFESYLPLLQPQGNFGTPFGDPASAPRYTESRLNDFSNKYVIGDLREAKECVDWGLNYDNTIPEPDFLPVAVPLALINGSFGIGLGKKVEMASYNISDVINATLTLIRDPNANICLIPDTCMPCEIYDEGQWQEICDTGYGYYTTRGVIQTEMYSSDEFKNRPALVVKSVPNMIYLDNVKDQIESLVAKKKIIQIEAMRDESSGDNLRWVIVLKPGADTEYVKNMLYQNTSLQDTKRINFEMLNGLNIVRPSYKEYLLFFIQHRKQTKYRVFVSRLRQVETKMHEVEAFIKLLESGKIDLVINKIRQYRKAENELVEYIVKLINVTDLQAKYIIGTRLGGLTAESLKKLKAQYKDLQAMQAQYTELITNDAALTEALVAELEEINRVYGCPRRSKLIKKAGAKDAIPKGSMLVGITQKGFIKKVPFSPTANFATMKGDQVKLTMILDNASDLLIYDSNGKVFRCPIHKIPFTDRSNPGVDIRFMFKGFNGDAVSCMPLDTLEQFRSRSKSKARFYLVSLSRAGMIKKMELDEFLNITSAGLIYAKLDSGDSVVSVGLVDSACSILPFNSKKVMRIPVESIPTMKRAARGSKTLSEGAERFTTFANREGKVPEYLLVVTRLGKVNKIHVSSIPALNTPKKEFSVIRIGKNDSIQNIMFANDADTLILWTTAMDKGLEFPVAGIPIGSTVSGGDKVLSPKDPIITSYLSGVQ